MSTHFDKSDDPEVISAIMKVAKQMRRTGNPQKAITAAKVELMFSKAIEEITEASGEPERKEAQPEA